MTYGKKFPTTENAELTSVIKKAYERLIMERTGHRSLVVKGVARQTRSLEGVQSYKRTDEQQQIAASNVLQQNAPGLQAQNAQQFPHQKRSAVWITVGSLSL